jgi:hypothetical protein
MTTPTAKSKKPSKEFLTALKDLKLIWDAGRIYFHIPELKERTRIKLQKQDDLVELGRKEGLSPKFVYHELRKEESNCLICNKQIVGRNHKFLCPECNDREQRQEHKESSEQKKKALTPIERYVDKIRIDDETPEYQSTFKQVKEHQNERHARHVASIFGAIEKLTPSTKPANMTNKEWQREKQRNNLREEEQGVKSWAQIERNHKFEWKNSPWWIMDHTLKDIGCRCSADELRAGECCKTCKVLIKVHEYLLDKFKDASQGRSTII